MTDLTPNHPAAEAAARAAHERAWCGESEPWNEVDDLERDEWRADEAHSLTAALPHLTADDLRNTPAGQALMAEAWEEGAMDRVRRVYIGRMSQKTLSIVRERIAGANPYLEGDA